MDCAPQPPVKSGQGRKCAGEESSHLSGPADSQGKEGVRGGSQLYAQAAGRGQPYLPPPWAWIWDLPPRPEARNPGKGTLRIQKPALLSLKSSSPSGSVSHKGLL